jgi:hypothetical protein
LKKTWRWGSVMGRAADVMRTAPTLAVAATALGVDRQTVHRWVKAGKIPPPGGGRRPVPATIPPVVPPESQSPPERFLEGLGYMGGLFTRRRGPRIPSGPISN